MPKLIEIELSGKTFSPNGGCPFPSARVGETDIQERILLLRNGEWRRRGSPRSQWLMVILSIAAIHFHSYKHIKLTYAKFHIKLYFPIVNEINGAYRWIAMSFWHQILFAAHPMRKRSMQTLAPRALESSRALAHTAMENGDMHNGKRPHSDEKRQQKHSHSHTLALAHAKLCFCKFAFARPKNESLKPTDDDL